MFELPPPRDSQRFEMSDGAIILARCYGRADGPRLVIGHGNGLSSDAFAPFWLPLCAKFDVVVFDLRNHGRNPPHETAAHTLPRFAEDFEELWHGIAREFGAKPAAGIFHSISAIVALMQDLKYGARFGPLVLFDPPIYPRPGHKLEAIKAKHSKKMAKLAERRPDRFKTPEDLAWQYANRKEFSRWIAGAHELVARTTVKRDAAKGDWTLICPKPMEVSIFENNKDPTIWPRLGELHVPVKFVIADPDGLDASPIPAVAMAIGEEFGIECESIPNTTHFLQIEQPDACIRATLGFLAKHGVKTD